MSDFIEFIACKDDNSGLIKQSVRKNDITNIQLIKHHDSGEMFCFVHFSDETAVHIKNDAEEVYNELSEKLGLLLSIDRVMQ